MDGCDPSAADRRVLLVGATNRPEVTCHTTHGKTQTDSGHLLQSLLLCQSASMIMCRVLSC